MTDAPNLSGQRIGAYEIVSPLGIGGMAVVYRAREMLHGGVSREVALKLIDSRLSSLPEFNARFNREAQTLVSMSHAHILKAFDYGLYQDSAYLVMELMSGGSLAELVRIVRVTVNEARQVVVGEGALLAGNGVQRHARLSDDPLAVPARDLAVVERPLGVFSPTLPAHPSRPDLVLRLKLDPLRSERPVIHLSVDPKLRQPLVHMARPTLPPVA